jgi:hypothetical protein
LEKFKSSLRASENAFRQECIHIIQKDYNGLAAAEKEAVSAEFEARLSARVFVQDFKKASWESRGAFLDALKFWSERGAPLPSSDEFSKGSPQGTIEEMRVKVKRLEEEFKRKY